MTFKYNFVKMFYCGIKIDDMKLIHEICNIFTDEELNTAQLAGNDRLQIPDFGPVHHKLVNQVWKNFSVFIILFYLKASFPKR